MDKPTQTAEADIPQASLVLIIDDYAGLRHVLQDFFHRQGYQVVTAASAEEAEKAKQRYGPEAIGIVVVDVYLTPNAYSQEGYVLYEQWSRLHPTLPFILMSGVTHSQYLPAIASGAVSFLAKPFFMESLFEKVKTLMRSP